MSLIHLNLKHRQTLGAALIALLMFMLLQACQMAQAHAMDTAEPEMSMTMSSDASGMDHDCCVPSPAEHLQKADQVCPDCDLDDHYLQFSHPDSKPAFTLLYIVAKLLQVDSEPSRVWLSEPPPLIQSSQPDIYLANVSFLE
ncbi:hypothetical protein [Endozoicomonas arenosclerae]|uniref:hypothetical protein n=1 Tax=Endozoicomonas arenosclerae TaxID=1633495 RepID=UPI000784552C|nr:hypothetical protein [Endozoicomonas arenosclerae]